MSKITTIEIKTKTVYYHNGTFLVNDWWPEDPSGKNWGPDLMRRVLIKYHEDLEECIEESALVINPFDFPSPTKDGLCTLPGETIFNVDLTRKTATIVGKTEYFTDKRNLNHPITPVMEEYANQKTEALNDLYQTSLTKYLEACTKIKALEERNRDLENRIIDYKERWLTKGT